ncbi:MAG: alcohol dehydrogenase catalytic domain-containing protein [Chitinispirillaceae bacterium]|nr:alcohol dehydrogenase catalytic domain-containing protein [Chitinispirillaceae bacterium]
MTGLYERVFMGKNDQSIFAIRMSKIEPGQRRPIIKVPKELSPLPREIEPYDVLVMIYICQICDTDVDMGTNPSHGAATEGYFEGKDPLILFGHEAGGVVITVGEKVTRINEGDWVSLKVREGMKSKKCIMCQAGMNHRCLYWQYPPQDMVEHGIFRAPGWFCQYSVLHEEQVTKIPAGLAPEYACMGEPISIAANSLMTALDRWWSEPGFLEATEEGPPAIAIIGAGGIASIGAPVYAMWPDNIIEAMTTGELPDNYLDRPYAETRRELAGLPPKKPAKAEVFYYARTPYRKGLLKADAVTPLGIRYISFEDMGLPYIEVVTKTEKKAGEGRIQKIYNLTPLMKHPARKRFDLVIEMCSNPLQVARMLLPPSEPGEVERFMGDKKTGRCEGRYEFSPSNHLQIQASDNVPGGGSGGLMAPGTKLVMTSITGGNDVYPNFPIARLCWASSLNNADFCGVVNYDTFHTKVGLRSLAMVCGKEGLKSWPKQIQERVVTDPKELLGEGMYNLKSSVSGRVAIEMNSMERIKKTLQISKDLLYVFP